jgi:formamidopyrimidine-DNA glycosylase
MPELPEVEQARRELDAFTRGRRILEVLTLESGGGPRSGQEDDIVLKTPASVRAALQGRRVAGTGRVGKVQWLALEPSGGALPGVVSIHFGMTGMLSFRSGGAAGGTSQKMQRYSVDASVWPPRFTKLELVLEGGGRVAFTDPRRLGRVLPHRDAAAAAAGLGPDAHDALPPPAALGALLAGRSGPVKAALLDQALLAGVGNYIADEVLFAARIHPESSAAAVAASPHRLAALHAAIKGVVGTAVAANADAAKFPRDWLFHRRWGKGKGEGGAETVGGEKIVWITVGGRTSAVVPSVQGRPFKTAAGAGAAGAGGGDGGGGAEGGGGREEGARGGGGEGPPQRGRKRAAGDAAAAASAGDAAAAAPKRKKGAAAAAPKAKQ